MLVALLLSASQAKAFGQVTVSPWQYHEGNEGIIEHPTNAGNAAEKQRQFKDAFQKAKIPGSTDKGWKVLTPANDGTVSLNVGSKIKSGGKQVDFTYFKTRVTVKGGVSEFKVTFGAVDDAARIYLNGKHIEASDIIGLQKAFKTVDLKSLVKQGENEVVIVQFDQFPPGNRIENIGVEVNGEEISAAGATKVSPWQMHEGNGPQIIEFETKTRDRFKNAYKMAAIPALNDKGWKAPVIRPSDGAVTFQRPSQVKKTAGQLDFTYFQTIATVPKKGVKKLQVEIDIVDDSARVYLFNSKYPNGYVSPSADMNAVLSKNIKVDLTRQVVPGENNRVVVVQFDQNRPGNTIWGLRLKSE